MPPEENIKLPNPPPPPGIPKIRTFKTDAEIYMHENQVSRLEMSTKNYVSQTAARWKLPEVNYKIYAYILGAVILFGGAGYFGYQIYLGNTPGNGPEPAKPVAYPSFLQAESETELSFTKGDSGSLTNAIKRTMGQQFKYGSVNYLKIRPGGSSPYSSSNEFIKTMAWNPPDAFLAHIEPAFNVFIVYQSLFNAPVFIFRTKNFSGSYAALLEWETGNGGRGSTLWQDLKPFIDLKNIDPASLYQKIFEDDLIKNNDARAFRTPNGKLLLEYVFFSKKYIIISPSREALDLVLGRFIALPPQ